MTYSTLQLSWGQWPIVHYSYPEVIDLSYTTGILRSLTYRTHYSYPEVIDLSYPQLSEVNDLSNVMTFRTLKLSWGQWPLVHYRYPDVNDLSYTKAILRYTRYHEITGLSYITAILRSMTYRTLPVVLRSMTYRSNHTLKLSWGQWPIVAIIHYSYTVVNDLSYTTAIPRSMTYLTLELSWGQNDLSYINYSYQWPLRYPEINELSLSIQLSWGQWPIVVIIHYGYTEVNDLSYTTGILRSLTYRTLQLSWGQWPLIHYSYPEITDLSYTTVILRSLTYRTLQLSWGQWPTIHYSYPEITDLSYTTAIRRSLTYRTLQFSWNH